MYSHGQRTVDVEALPQSIPVRIIFIKESLNLHRLEITESTVRLIDVMEINTMSNLNLSNLNSRQFSNVPMSADASIASQTESQYIEVSGLMDDFISIEEFAPGSNWDEVLAASWGIPCATQPEKSHDFSGIKAFGLRRVQSILQSFRSKKFEVA